VPRISARLGVGSRGNVARTLLDVGCGYGFFSRQARSAGFEVTAIEMSEHQSSVARELSGVIPIATSFEAYQPQDIFHAVLMSQVLEHALDPAEWVSKACGLLTGGGVIAIAVPNYDGVFRRVLGVSDFMIIPPAHRNYFSPRSLTHLLERSGFQHMSIEHVTRIPRETTRRRLGSSLALVRGVELLTRPLCGMVDLFGVGGIMNVYATDI
jgi:2-polyprenyl-3-methyl-5-hydroxy-6-metoxy-1,4-benzoquinol methylase